MDVMAVRHLGMPIVTITVPLQEVAVNERHVVRNASPHGGWKVVGPQTGSTISRAATQAGAIVDAEQELEDDGGGQVVIHGIRGQVSDRRTVEPRTSTSAIGQLAWDGER